MPLTDFPNGISSFGVPVLGGGVSIPPTTGNVFFVDSGANLASDDANQGTSPDLPFATIDYAIGQCTASNGDIILVMPGHSESLTGATDIALDVAGVSIIGLGQAHTRPQLVYDNAAGAVAITASNTRISNIVFVASVATITNAIVADATIEHVEIDHCHFTYDATGLEFVVMIKLGNGATDSADYVHIHDNWFQAENVDGCSSAILIDDCDYLIIERNLFTGDFNSVALDGAAASSACSNYVVRDNDFQNLDTGLTIDLDDAATGVCFRNFVAGGGALASNVDWGACQVAENYITDAADVTGVVIPTTAAS